MIPVYFCQNNDRVINFTTDDMISKFETFKKNKMDELYFYEIMRTEWLQMIYEFWYEGDTPYSGDFDLFLQCLFKYYDDCF